MRRDNWDGQGQGSGPAPRARSLRRSRFLLPRESGRPAAGGGSVPGAGSPGLRRHRCHAPPRDRHVTPALPLSAAAFVGVRAQGEEAGQS